MDLKLEFGRSLCYTPIFEINGIKADSSDFGDKHDQSPETAEEYGCGDMQFFAKPADDVILSKYKITHSEYEEIAVKLTNGLSFGSCGLCI